MAFASGVSKQLRYKVESAWGTAPGATGAQLLRRVSSTLSLRKQTYESNEMVTHFQRNDFRHGVRSIEGAISGEVSPGTYQAFMGAALRRAATAVTEITGMSITIAASGANYSVTRAAGSFLTGGIKTGFVVRLTAGSFNANNLNKNLFVLAVTETVLTVKALNGDALTAEGPIASATMQVPGKVNYAPATGHLNQSFSIEHWHSDINQSELFTGCKVQSMAVQLPPTGMSSIDFAFLGKNLTTNTSAYYTSPTAETTTGVLAAVNGVMIAQGAAIALLTGLNFTLNANLNGTPVVGSNTYADVSQGRIAVEGQVTALFEDATIRDYFVNETEVSLAVALATSNSAAADFVSFILPRVKFGGADKDDSDRSIVQTLPFTALYNSSGGSGVSSEATTLEIQDSQAA